MAQQNTQGQSAAGPIYVDDLLKNKVVLVTGGSGGVGLEVCAQMAEAGATVVLLGRTEASSQAAAKRLEGRKMSGRCVPMAADMLERKQILDLVARIERDFGRLDAVVNCAASGPPGISGYFEKTDPEQYAAFSSHIVVTLMQLTHACIPLLRKSGGGAIIAFTSDAGKFAAPRQTVGSMAFAGIIGFVRNLALEVARDHIRVHCITPSYIKDTPIYDRITACTGRTSKAEERAGLGLPTPADIAPLIVFLCSPGSAHMTGQILSVNGGLNT